jgi:MFS family permease
VALGWPEGVRDRVGRPPRSAERAVMVGVALGAMLVPLNSTMLAVALPEIARDLGADLLTASWLATAYLAVAAAGQPVAGRLGDRLGHRRMVLVGLVLFGLASLGATFAPGIGPLLLFRVLQAVAGAIVLPNGSALLGAALPATRRAGGFGLVGALLALAAAIGPPLGGALAGALGWRAIFGLNVALALPVLFVSWRSPAPAPPLRPDGALRTEATVRSGLRRPDEGTIALSPGPPVASVGEAVGKGVDVAGAALLLAAVGGLVGLLMPDGRQPLPRFLLGAAVVAVTAALLAREARHPDPVLDLRLFGDRSFAAASASIALSNLAMYSTLLAVPMLLTGRPGWTSLEIGLLLAVLMGGLVLCAPIGGRLADRAGRRWPTVAGLALLACAALPLAWPGGAVSTTLLVASLAAAGVGLGLSSPGVVAAALEAAGPEDAGAASGAFSMSRYLGGIVGAALLPGRLEPALAGEGFGPAFSLVAAAALLALLASLALHDWPAGETRRHRAGRGSPRR